MLKAVGAWQEWDAREKRVQEAKWGDQGSDKEEEDDDDGLPFACYICRCVHLAHLHLAQLLHSQLLFFCKKLLPPATCAAGSHGKRWRIRS